MKILYLMAIDWGWIKQRPQFLALMLNKKHEVDVFYLSEIFQKKEKQLNERSTHKCCPIPAVPFRDKAALFSFVQRCLFKLKIHGLDKYDAVWLGHPALFKYVPQKYKGYVIYDCMDYYWAMCDSDRIKKTIEDNERKLLKRADLIFASSNYLLNHLADYGEEKRAVLLRNGYEAGTVRYSAYEKKQRYKLAYIGTVAEWFDIDLLLKSLERVKEIEYHILGPRMLTLPDADSIVYDGVREHAELPDYSEQMDCLIMPFRVCEIVEAVDPVKLYEYISMGKCIISVYYKEIERFSPFVYFYRTQEEYIALLMELCESGFEPKYSPDEQSYFLGESSWEKRGECIEDELQKIGQER